MAFSSAMTCRAAAVGRSAMAMMPASAPSIATNDGRAPPRRELVRALLERARVDAVLPQPGAGPDQHALTTNGASHASACLGDCEPRGIYVVADAPPHGSRARVPRRAIAGESSVEENDGLVDGYQWRR
jgi:hypothetical protein